MSNGNGDSNGTWRGIVNYIVRNHAAIGATVIAVTVAVGGCLDHFKLEHHEQRLDIHRDEIDANTEKIDANKDLLSKTTEKVKQLKTEVDSIP